MKYILFILLMNGDLTTAEFNSNLACAMAIASAKIKTIEANQLHGTPLVAAAWCDMKDYGS